MRKGPSASAAVAVVIAGLFTIPAMSTAVRLLSGDRSECPAETVVFVVAMKQLATCNANCHTIHVGTGYILHNYNSYINLKTRIIDDLSISNYFS